MKMIAITAEEGLEICKNGLWFSDEEARKMYFATDENRDGVWIFNTEKERAEAIEKHNNPMPDPRTEEIDGKYYDVYFDPAYLVVDTEGRLENPEALQIVEFEYDDETEEVTDIRRVDAKGNILEDPWKGHRYMDNMNHVGENDFPTISKALGAFEGWLTDHLDWRESWRGDYYNPPEYICAGIEGYVDEPPYRPKHIDRDLIRAILRKH